MELDGFVVFDVVVAVWGKRTDEGVEILAAQSRDK